MPTFNATSPIANDPNGAMQLHGPQPLLLIHSDTTDQSTTFTDSSGSNVTLTAIGGVHHEVDQKKFGATSIAFDGSGDYLSAGDSVELGGGDFTLECWVRPTAYPTNNNGVYASLLIAKDLPNARSFGFQLKGTASSFTGISFTGFATNTTYTVVSGTYSFALNTWYHVACVRNGNFIFFYVNGVCINPGGTEFSRVMQNVATAVTIGGFNYGSGYYYYLNGYIDELRILPYAAWGSNFTPPTTAYSNDGNDYASKAVAGYRSGDSQGSIEFWFKSSYKGDYQFLFATADTATTSRFLALGTDVTTGFFTIQQRNNDVADYLVTTTDVCDGEWHHCVVASNGTAWTVYLDGVSSSLSVITGANTGDWFADTPDRDNISIGALIRTTAAYYVDGSLDEVAVYDYPLPAEEVWDHYQEGLSSYSQYKIQGTVRDDTGALAARTVRVYDRATGSFIAETTSDGTTGVFELVVPFGDTDPKTVLALDDEAGTVHNALVYDHVVAQEVVG